VIHTVVRLTVYGDSHAELLENAQRAVASYLQVSVEEVPRVAMYELQVEECDDPLTGDNFQALVIARVK
jgi:SHS2 domain-containing protein